MTEQPQRTRVRSGTSSPWRKLIIALLTLLLSPALVLLGCLLLLLNLVRGRAGRPHVPDEPANTDLASIVILSWNGKGLLARGLPSVIEAVKRDGRPHEILVVDNGSSDGSAEFLRAEFPQVRLVELPENAGFARGNNAGVHAARHDVVVLLNNDMIVDPGFLRPLLDCFGPKTFAVSCRIRPQDPGAVSEETGRTRAVFRRGMVDFGHLDVDERTFTRDCCPVFWAGGGSSAFHRKRFLLLGGFADIYSPAYVEDADLSFQAWRAGWEVSFAPKSIVRHRHRATTSVCFSAPELQRLILRNQFLFLWKNIQSWRLLLSHCAFLPWNCYRLARDSGLGAWLGLARAAAAVPELPKARMSVPPCPERTDAEVFRLFAGPAPGIAVGPPRKVPSEIAGAVPRLLWLTAYLPYLGRHAGAGRMYHLLRRMAGKYRITLLSLYEDEEERRFLPDLETLCERVVALPRVTPRRWQWFAYEPFDEFLVPAMQRALENCLAGGDFDLIQLEYTQMAAYARRPLGLPTLLTKHEVDFAACARRARTESNPLRKLRWFYNYLQVLDREIRLLQNIDAAICMTDPDMRELRKFCAPIPIHVVNTGVDLDYFLPPEQPAASPRLVFVGAFQHEPNVDAMTWFCGRVWPGVRAAVPEASLAIVGSHPPPAVSALAELPGVEVTGFVPDIRPWMAAAAVYIVPVRLGVGIRGKILEAWSMALPVATTSLGCAGLHYRQGETLLVGNTEEEFADRVITLLKDPELRARVGREGRRVAQQFYGWDAVAERLDGVYREYVRRPRGGMSFGVTECD